MSFTGRPESDLLQDTIYSEIKALGARQEALLRGSAFVALTREEAEELNHCTSRMADLVEQLGLLCPNAHSSLGGHHEQEAEKAEGNGREGD